jgi:hypothetical protein
MRDLKGPENITLDILLDLTNVALVKPYAFHAHALELEHFFTL